MHRRPRRPWDLPYGCLKGLVPSMNRRYAESLGLSHGNRLRRPALDPVQHQMLHRVEADHAAAVQGSIPKRRAASRRLIVHVQRSGTISMPSNLLEIRPVSGAVGAEVHGIVMRRSPSSPAGSNGRRVRWHSGITAPLGIMPRMIIRASISVGCLSIFRGTGVPSRSALAV
jgi:hypothetical protein